MDDIDPAVLARLDAMRQSDPRNGWIMKAMRNYGLTPQQLADVMDGRASLTAIPVRK